MRILFFGEYSNLHATLAKSLKKKGHDVLVISDGGGWRNYPHDIDISRTNPQQKTSGIRLLLKLLSLLPKLKNFDVVQIINPSFLPLRPIFSRLMLKYLKRNNKSVSMGCFGIDSIVLKSQNEGCLEYSDTFCYGKRIHEEDQMIRVNSWFTPEAIKTTEYAADISDCLIACLFEYYKNYSIAAYKDKLYYIGLPIEIDFQTKPKNIQFPVKVLVGSQKERIIEKGIDQIVSVLERFKNDYPDKIEITFVQNIPFSEYQKKLIESDIVADQIYSYTPAMNALEAMKNGTIAISGGEEDYYDFIGEKELRPIINLRPFNDEENYEKLKSTLLDLKKLNDMSSQAIEFVRKFHDADTIAQQYIDVYSSLLKNKDK